MTETGSNVLVTGALGRAGTAILDHLEDYDFALIDREPSPDTDVTVVGWLLRLARSPDVRRLGPPVSHIVTRTVDPSHATLERFRRLARADLGRVGLLRQFSMNPTSSVTTP